MATPLKIALVKKDMTQGKLATAVDVSETSISSIVREKSKPDVLLALKIAKAVGATVEELWGHLLREGKNEGPAT